MAQLTPAEQNAKTAAEAAAFAARRKAPAAGPFNPFGGADLAAKSAKIKAARAVVAGTVRILEDGKLLSEVAFADAAAIGAAVQAEIGRHTALASTQNLAKPAARYTRRIKVEIDVAVT
jgi:hypothetical protein